MSDEEKEKKEQKLKEFLGQNTKIIDIADTFDFQCQQCGMCCMHRQDIIVNPWDLYQIAKHENMPPKIIVDKYMICELGSHSRIPMVVLDCDKEPNHWCPFLELDVKDGCKFKCRIHECSPGACQNHPIGTMFQYDKSSKDWSNPVVHFCKVEQCDNSKGHNHPVSVRDWTKNYMDNLDNITLAHEIQSLCNDYFMADEFMVVSSYIDRCASFGLKRVTDLKKRDAMKKASKAVSMVVDTFTNGTIYFGYLNYDTSRDFAEQAKENIKVLRDLYEHTKEMLDVYKKEIGIPDDVKDVKKWILKDSVINGVIDEAKLPKDFIDIAKKYIMEED